MAVNQENSGSEGGGHLQIEVIPWYPGAEILDPEQAGQQFQAAVRIAEILARQLTLPSDYDAWNEVYARTIEDLMQEPIEE